jgi:23S rRNA (guanosine2251-2'-O)-methyltransferase
MESGNRTVERIFIHHTKKPNRALSFLERQAKRHNVPVEHVEQEKIDELASGTTHGGAVAMVGERKYVELADLGAEAKAPFIVMLDGVEDPFNFGQAIRAIYAAGADGLVLRPRNWTTATSVVGRSSAGASEYIPIAIAETALDAMLHFQERGLKIACTATRGKTVSIYDADLSQPLFMLIGGEKRGITRSVLDQADLLLEIPYAQAFNQSLGTTASASILAFEVMRQRKMNA